MDRRRDECLEGGRGRKWKDKEEGTSESLGPREVKGKMGRSEEREKRSDYRLGKEQKDGGKNDGRKKI
jgi:hypothetical protein